MSEWITDREPTAKDAPMNYIIVWEESRQFPFIIDYGDWHKRYPWMPIEKPEPYVKPKRWQIEWDSRYHLWLVKDAEGHIGAVLCSDIPSPEKYREAAERIAAIYNEVIK